MLHPNSTCELLLSDTQGIYIPRDFYNDFNFRAWHLNKKNFRALKNPDHEWYWEAWDELLNKAWYKAPDGHKWHLSQDGDLFMYRDDHKFEGEDEDSDD
jgi:hypothetical protein